VVPGIRPTPPEGTNASPLSPPNSSLRDSTLPCAKAKPLSRSMPTHSPLNRGINRGVQSWVCKMVRTWFCTSPESVTLSAVWSGGNDRYRASRTAASFLSCLAFCDLMILTIPAARAASAAPIWPTIGIAVPTAARPTPSVTVARALPALPWLAASKMSATSTLGQGRADRCRVDHGLEAAQELGGVVVELRDLGAKIGRQIKKRRRDPTRKITGLLRRCGLEAIKPQLAPTEGSSHEFWICW
jgi:hypothetical protein